MSKNLKLILGESMYQTSTMHTLSVAILTGFSHLKISLQSITLHFAGFFEYLDAGPV
jgi:hypothetical protein